MARPGRLGLTFNSALQSCTDDIGGAGSDDRRLMKIVQVKTTVDRHHHQLMEENAVAVHRSI